MASPNPAIRLFFTSSIYARGADIVGANATNEEGHINMVRIPIGSTKAINANAARDLIIAGQAVDAENSKPSVLSAAQKAVKEYEETSKRAEAIDAAQKANREESGSMLQNVIAELVRAIQSRTKKTA